MTTTLMKPPPGQVSEEEFRQFLDQYEGPALWELMDGEIRTMPEPSMLHELLVSWLMVALQNYLYRHNPFWTVHPRMLCSVDPLQNRRPDLAIVDLEAMEPSEQRQAVLADPPKIAIEVVSTNWKDDYQTKSALYAAFGIAEYWIVDFLLTRKNHPFLRNPEIEEPTLSIGLLQNNRYQWQRYTGNRRIVSPTLSDLDWSVDFMLNHYYPRP